MKAFRKDSLYSGNFFSIFQAIKMCISQETSFKSLQHQQAKNFNSLKMNPKFKKKSPNSFRNKQEAWEALLWSVKKRKMKT